MEQTQKKLLPKSGIPPKIERICQCAIAVLAIMFLGFLALTSLMHTTGMENIPEGQGVGNCVYHIRAMVESVIYYNDNFILNLLFLVLSVALCFVIIPRAKKLPMWSLLATVSLWTVVWGAVWVYTSQVSPTEDSQLVTLASAGAARGDFVRFEDRYFRNYPFQCGYVLFNELLIRIHNLFTPYRNVLFLEVLNAVFLAGIYDGLLLINQRLFRDKRICMLTTLFFLLSVQPIIFTVFTYGILPGLLFAVWALYFEILYLQTGKFGFAVLSAVLIAIAVLIKSNNLIFLIAMMTVAFITLINRKQYVRDSIYIVAAVALSLSVSPMAKGIYEARSGFDFGEPIPYVSWLAMGVNEASVAPGWYNNAYTVANFEMNQFDADVAGSVSKQIIKERLRYFARHPQYANDFFYQKTVSQWNETSYQSIWNNEVRRQFKAKSGIAAWVCGDGERPVKKYMDIFTQLIFAACFLSAIACLKNKNFLSILLPLVIFGGFLYHTISEGKSQYILPYYILMTAFAPYGICRLYDFLAPRLAGKKRLVSVFGFGIQ